MGYPCPCCGYKTLPKPAGGTYDICPVCFWEDDGVQLDDPDYPGGANKPSLREAQRNFQAIGAESETSLAFTRAPTAEENRDSGWSFLAELP